MAVASLNIVMKAFFFCMNIYQIVVSKVIHLKIVCTKCRLIKVRCFLTVYRVSAGICECIS